MSQSEKFPMIAKTMAELEDVLAEELINLGADDVEIGNRMVSFSGDQALMYKANVHCRTALRILKPIYEFKAENPDEVYEQIKSIDWDQYLSLDRTFSIDAVVFSHIFSHSKFVAYRVKDAVVDWFHDRYNKRPSVSVSNPDLVLNIHIAHKTCTLSLDSSGDSLHKRGYRTMETEAPLNEVLAAGMILKSGWRGESDFVDPMCGSGTLLIEAGMLAMGIPPGIHRDSFGFEKWADFDADLFSDVYNDESHAREFKHRIIGSDVSPRAIAAAERNVKNAGLSRHVELSVRPFQQYTEAPAEEGVMMTNPPYGERIKVNELDELYNMIGERMKHLFAGWDCYVLSYKKEQFDQIGLRPTKRFFLFNGALECEMRHYEIFSGKRAEFDEDDRSAVAKKRERRSARFVSKERNSREGYRRSRREAEEQNRPEGEEGGFGRDRGDRRETPGDRVGRAFDRHERRGPRPRTNDREFRRRDDFRRDGGTDSRRREGGGDRDFRRDGGDRPFRRREGGAPRSGGEGRGRDFRPRDGQGGGRSSDGRRSPGGDRRGPGGNRRGPSGDRRGPGGDRRGPSGGDRRRGPSRRED